MDEPLRATTQDRAQSPLLSVRGLSLAAGSGPKRVSVTRDVSFDLAPGERVGVVGESGCGKTATGLAILNLLPSGLSVAAGEVLFRGENLLAMSPRPSTRSAVAASR
jgi:peptide/nickel transport system ATP-binding protein